MFVSKLESFMKRLTTPQVYVAFLRSLAIVRLLVVWSAKAYIVDDKKGKEIFCCRITFYLPTGDESGAFYLLFQIYFELS